MTRYVRGFTLLNTGRFDLGRSRGLVRRDRTVSDGVSARAHHQMLGRGEGLPNVTDGSGQGQQRGNVSHVGHVFKPADRVDDSHLLRA